MCFVKLSAYLLYMRLFRLSANNKCICSKNYISVTILTTNALRKLSIYYLHYAPIAYALSDLSASGICA